MAFPGHASRSFLSGVILSATAFESCQLTWPRAIPGEERHALQPFSFSVTGEQSSTGISQAAMACQCSNLSRLMRRGRFPALPAHPHRGKGRVSELRKSPRKVTGVVQCHKGKGGLWLPQEFSQRGALTAPVMSQRGAGAAASRTIKGGCAPHGEGSGQSGTIWVGCRLQPLPHSSSAGCPLTGAPVGSLRICTVGLC